MTGFPWSECQVRKLTTSHCTSSETINGMDVCKEVERHTRESVQSPLVVLKLKVRKGGDFFYGKSSNENHFESV